MIDYEARTKARVEEAVAQAQEQAQAVLEEKETSTAVTFIKRQMSKGNNYTLEQAIELVTDNLGYTEETARKAYIRVTEENELVRS